MSSTLAVPLWISNRLTTTATASSDVQTIIHNLGRLIFGKSNVSKKEKKNIAKEIMINYMTFISIADFF